MHFISVTEPSSHCLYEMVRDNKTPQSVYRCVECVQLLACQGRSVDLTHMSNVCEEAVISIVSYFLIHSINCSIVALSRQGIISN